MEHNYSCFCSVHQDNTLKDQIDNSDDDQAHLERYYPYRVNNIPEIPEMIADNPGTASQEPNTDPSLLTVAPPVPDTPPLSETPLWLINNTPFQYPAPLAHTSPSRRGNLEETSSDVFGTSNHNPGCVASYALAIKDGGLAIIKTQTWSGIYRENRFWLRNLEYTTLEDKRNGDFTVNLKMRRGGNLTFSMETYDEASEMHHYLFSTIGR